MALKKTITTAQGLTATNAYHRVESVSLLGKDKISFHLRSYTSTSMPFFQEEHYVADYSLSGSNPIEQAYVYLKALSDWSDAEDV
tara:strand:+ start:1483 stop:1737 length:255 start_codon:yes stop_codon:yes gene_type:complete